MKRILKWPLKLVWRRMAFIRVRLETRCEAMIVRCFQRVQPPHVCHVSVETGLLMDHLIRELVRLRAEVDQMRQTLDDLVLEPGVLSVVGAEESESSPRRSSSVVG